MRGPDCYGLTVELGISNVVAATRELQIERARNLVHFKSGAVQRLWQHLG
ncbi:hypothetical protein BU14_0049s0028 [Porphyra umbilicalis]|uniref:Uncharacterized protein n=1 Tax=Porphyra umbilicalis TaxID=2786 RepID=A0A1X6PI68_PORUM|nr:hypothetical protein BU14_0049s0028 [Porphyra umbilicalis]|eukprot:OSX80584.1 hypothetical protein BU14_0049s0028 [Porphyra umbilicalis]